MITVRISRTLIAAAAVSFLAGCAGGSGSADIAPAAAPPPPVEPAPQVSVQQQPLPPAPTGRATRGAPPPPPQQQAAPAPQVALTPEEVKAQCWMKYENDKRIKNIDARLQLVEKCVADTSRGQPPAR
ncbi:MAG TPA: hypothetical protein VJT13_26315 [Xanthobacteraceae bacterium]|nr:hypothetical protein [Xanthobacteraceae bacterium]